MNRRSPLLALLTVFVAGVSVMAHVNGAIFTTVADGTTVNGNIYQSKSDVYLNGGPQNENGSGLSPDGLYYFQVTDPSGAVLLSTDPIECRMVVVSGGRITNVASASTCAHSTGAFNSANGTLPVQLMPFADTPNHGGEYKAWLTPVDQYGDSCKAQQGSFGFCDSWSKTDNFKVRASAPRVARVTVCKFNDYNADGQQGQDEPFIAHWPITAEGVDGGTITAQTGDEGCTTFAVSDFSSTKTSQRVVLSEGSFGPDWTQTAPQSCGSTPNCKRRWRRDHADRERRR